MQKGFGGFVGSQARSAKPIALFRVGDRVIHRSFGRGRVVEVMGAGEEQRVRVAFDGSVEKVFSASIAPIVKVSE